MASKNESCPTFNGKLDFEDWDTYSKDDKKAIESFYYEICAFMNSTTRMLGTNKTSNNKNNTKSNSTQPIKINATPTP
jgi:hypothetical protein